MAYTLNSGQPKPYVYQEYPRRLYKRAEKPCSVNSDEERAAKEAVGWSIDQQFAPPVPVVPPAAEPEAPADTATVVADAPRRGRPPKVRP